MRLKLIVILVCAVILTCLALLRTSFFATETFTRWQELTWDDFKGTPVLFTGWGARISSNIYTEYDSTTNSYVAYAAMNNHESWKKLSFEGSNYTLNHEQYHFNLTESFARLLNKKIKQDSLNEYEISAELSKMRTRVYQLQKQYDEEANHGLNTDMQRYWEFKIDSMMVVHTGKSGVFIDYVSEAGVFVPFKSTPFSGDNDGSAYRAFTGSDYDMSFVQITSIRSPVPFTTFEKEMLINYEDEHHLVSYHNDDTISRFNHEMTFELYNNDSSEYIIDKCILTGGFVYQMRVTFPPVKQSEGYRKIANAMLNSFNLYDSKHYWKSKWDSTDGFYVNEVTNERATLEEYKESYCAVYKTEEGVDYGLIGSPVILEDGFIMPFEPTRAADSLIHEVKIITKDNVSVSLDIESYDDFLFVPENMDQGYLEFSIGYTLKEDTSQVCFQFYSNYLVLDMEFLNRHNRLQ